MRPNALSARNIVVSLGSVAVNALPFACAASATIRAVPSVSAIVPSAQQCFVMAVPSVNAAVHSATKFSVFLAEK